MQAGLEHLSKAPTQHHRAHFREWLLSAAHDRARLADTSLSTYLDYIAGPMGQPSFFEHQVRHYDSRHAMGIAHRYAELGARPVKLIWAAGDAWQVVDWAYKLHDAIPGSELDIIEEDCGHFAPEDRPEKISELLIVFLNRHR